ncbi:high nitrogen upregulated cytochrome P450 monooxygenase 2 [Mycena olivaceomarginata]|nr:high nitrogen upregulated cytochrome P450 monooxygenase 2 [Mycena olivaceomarginata]
MEAWLATTSPSMPSLEDPRLVAIGLGLLTHLVFKTTEPRQPRRLLSLENYAFSSVTTAVLSVFSIYFATLLTSLALYRLSPFHPLAQYPGPILHKLSNFQMVRVALTGKRHLYITELHKKYGSHVRVGPNVLSVVHVDAIAATLGTKPGMPKGEMYHSLQPPNEPTSLIGTLDMAEHAEKRKSWSQGFTPTALKEYDPIIQGRTNQLVQRLEQQVGTIDLGKWISYFTFDFMGDIAFGGGFEMIREGDTKNLWPVIIMAMKAGSITFAVPWVRGLASLLPMGDDFKRMLSFAAERVDIRQRRGPISKDLFYHITDEDSVTGRNITPPEIPQDIMLAIIAGSDTTSSVLANLFYSLLRNPDVYAKLKKEIDNAFGADEDTLDVAKLQNMVYLNACINEALRLFPAVPTFICRSPKVGGGPVLVAGRVVPEGTNILLPFWALQRDARYFSMPDKFWPERWIERTFHNKTDAFCAFSQGSQQCSGKALAYREMRVVITMILKKFDVMFEEGYNPEDWEAGLRDDTVIVKDKLPVTLTVRGHRA